MTVRIIVLRFWLIIALYLFNELESFKQYSACYRAQSSSMIPIWMNKHANLDEAIEVLDKYNTAFIIRMKQARKEGLSPKVLEFKRIQMEGGDAIKMEREELRRASVQVAASSKEVVLGIMTDSVSNGINTLKNYVKGLNLPRGVIRAVDTNGDEVPVDSLKDSPVYLKYNSSSGGDVYMKSYDGGHVGVILQPRLAGDDWDTFRQWGNLPLPLF